MFPFPLIHFSCESSSSEDACVKPRSSPFKPYHVLVAGEAGVGKSAFIRALCEATSQQSSTFSESVYKITTTMETTRIPEINSAILERKSVIDNVKSRAYGEVISNFIMKQHGPEEDRFKLLKECESWYSNIPEASCFREIVLHELPHTTREVPPKFVDDFDKVVIVADYHDITTLRSAQCWAELIRPPKRKTIVCVNKCEVEPKSRAEDFRDRKAAILRHFSEQCSLEFISVATGANIPFLYKHLEPDY
jgi:hypothetical protein